LLALVQQYKKEALPKDKAIRRLNLVEYGKAPAGSHVVFAPLPTVSPTLQEAADILAQLKHKRSNDGRPCILFLSD
jgi:hypothetical protein